MALIWHCKQEILVCIYLRTLTWYGGQDMPFHLFCDTHLILRVKDTPAFTRWHPSDTQDTTDKPRHTVFHQQGILRTIRETYHTMVKLCELQWPKPLLGDTNPKDSCVQLLKDIDLILWTRYTFASTDTHLILQTRGADLAVQAMDIHLTRFISFSECQVFPSLITFTSRRAKDE